MTLPRLDAMRKYWVKNPPAHQLIAHYMQYKPPEEKEKPGNIDDFIKAMGGISG